MSRLSLTPEQRARTGGAVTEAEIQAAVIEALQAMGVMVERVQSGKVKVRGGWMRLASEGTPDLWTSLGWLECKTEKGLLSDEQIAWHARARDAGVNVAVVRSAADAVRIVQLWRRQKGRAA